ncbi:MFS transporter [Alkalispirochaeta sphaeroplastigenens]|uniref:MFS transporter n=1 Tax=Alkalispirochaeta sphaeroplastigenens TaxID=1187066 RepID=A0A2S4K1J8_9SPIO|nr:MFS transporter [Alkalispirochaeta sphaeroplastigenens]POR05635.1 MFS transporter [Alkalispirochaeta sphaeroplastigenens]
MATLLLVLIYISFISLGLPDGILGAAWPVMQAELAVPYGFAGLAQMLVSGGTIISSMLSGVAIHRFGTGRLTAGSVAITATALMGYALAPSFLWILLCALPLGIGAGAVDATLNSYVANHYQSRHMSWIHCFWGVGALGGPIILSIFLAGGESWRKSYLTVGSFQIFLVALLCAALPLWDKVSTIQTDETREHRIISPGRAARIRGVPSALAVFLFYCGIEATLGLWGGSFLFKVRNLEPALAARGVSLFYASITAGRFLTGFLTYRLKNNTMIGGGALIALGGIILMALPLPLSVILTGFFLTGFGCAPIFPCMLHETPLRFGREYSRSIMGFQMALAYIGSTFLPLFFGYISTFTGMGMLPFFLMAYALILLANFARLRTLSDGTRGESDKRTEVSDQG